MSCPIFLKILYLIKYLLSTFNKHSGYCCCRSIKWYLTNEVNFYRHIEGDAESTSDTCFRSTPEIILHPHEIAERIQQAVDQLDGMCEDYIGGGSGWLINNMG